MWLVLPLFLAGFSTDISPDNKLEVWQQRTDSGPPPAAVSAKRRNHEVPSSTVPRVVIDTQLEHWIQWTLERNIALAATLKRLRDSYKLLQTGKPGEDAEEILRMSKTY